MLVYIREDRRKQILQTPGDDAVSKLLTDKFKEEAGTLNAMRRELDVDLDCGVVYLISPETVAANWIDGEDVNVPQNLQQNEEFQQSPIQRVKVKIRLSSTIQDLRTKIRVFTGVAQNQILLFRVELSRRTNVFAMVTDGVQSNPVFRKKRATEVFFVRFKSDDEQGKEDDFEPRLNQQPDDEASKVFVPYSDFEKKQLSQKYNQKKQFAKVKDLDSRYERIYSEKTEQYWRFA